MTIKMAFENLTGAESEALNAALVAAQHGATVVLNLSYHKVTATAPRLAEVDYRPMAGVTKDRLIGTVKAVKMGKKGPYVLLDATLVRAPINGAGETSTAIGWTSIRPEGIDSAQVLSIVPAKAGATA
jgi:hypothetical protein